MTTTIADLEFFHLDVFTNRPLSGNGVIVFPDAGGLDGDTMLLLTQELRQFESIFLVPGHRTGSTRARIFTTEEELEFAGHPILGAATVQHHLRGDGPDFVSTFELGGRTLDVSTTRQSGHYAAVMNQGTPHFEDPIDDDRVPEVLNALGLRSTDLAPGLPIQVVSTGLAYLLVPLRSGIERVSISHRDFGGLLQSLGARFCYSLDVDQIEGRTFDNHGLIEDVATGSAAGPAGAYLVTHGRAEPDTSIVLHQGRFLGRPSRMTIDVAGSREAIDNVSVAGDVAFVGAGRLGDPPRPSEAARG
jgi:PhzF family phenazine biosynthesis protein